MKKFLFNKQEKQAMNGIFWNALGGAAFAGQSAVILVFVSDRMGMETAGMVMIAYAIANLFYAAAQYGVRNFQVTDVREKYGFTEYLMARAATITAVMAAFFIYLLYSYYIKGYSYEKLIIIMEITVWKQVDAFEDVFVGQYQRAGRLDLGARMMAVRLIVSTGLVCLLIIIGIDIKASFAAGILLSVIIDAGGIQHSFYIVRGKKQSASVKKAAEILRECFPLCIGITFSCYVGNAPKYLIDSWMDEKTQAVFGYIMLPVFAVVLLNNFIYQPAVKGMGDIWEQKRVREFRRKAVKQCAIIAAITVCMCFAGLWIGMRVLSCLYHVDLKFCEIEFIVLLLGGGFYAMAVYLNVPLTVMRRQRVIAVGYLAVSFFSVFFGRYFVIHGGMMGAAALYFILNAVLVAGYLAVLFYGTEKQFRFDR